jgi:hypothetical protein
MVPTEEELRASWLAKVRSDDDFFQDVGWAHLQPLREAVAALAASEWAGRLLAGSSHERLVVVALGRWPIRHVCVIPTTDGLARILRRDSDWETHCGQVLMEGLFEALRQHLEWLVSKTR